MIFVTGATGMVGANLIALFERNNVEYKALKRKSSTLNIVKNVSKYIYFFKFIFIEFIE